MSGATRPDLVDRGGRECERCDRPVHGGVEDRDHLARLLQRVDEGDQPPVEPEVGELDEQGVAHRLRADAGAVRQEEHRHGGAIHRDGFVMTKVSQTWLFGRVGRAAPQGGAECAVGLHDVITPSQLEASPASVALDMIWTCSWTPPSSNG